MTAYPDLVLAALQQQGRRMALEASAGLAGERTDRELREAVAGIARDLAAAAEELYFELHPPDPVPPDGPGIGPKSSTAEVVAWVRENGLEASAKVVRAWVWLEGHSGLPENLSEIGKAAGFVYSPKRAAWFHTCGVASSRVKAPRPKSLARCHGVSTVETFTAGKHEPDPAWLREKAARSARKAALKGSGPVPRFGG